MRNKKSQQRGLTLIEILVGMAIILTTITIVGGYTLISQQSLKGARAANRMNAIAEAVAVGFARQKLAAPKTGIIWVAADGAWQVDPATPPEGKTFEQYNYEAKVLILSGGTTYVLVCLNSNQKIFTSASAQYQKTS